MTADANKRTNDSYFFISHIGLYIEDKTMTRDRGPFDYIDFRTY